MLFPSTECESTDKNQLFLPQTISSNSRKIQNQHVTFTNSEGGEEVGVVKGFSNGSYSIERKNKEIISVEESKVKPFHVSSVNQDNCPVVGTA
ncbi:hypothetical protein ABW20_dc0104872 [Dactylellina cionopaga]|nr:hypothetical protein ABW20_dc0104872 [Dactylellina cionopaga]